MRTTLLLGISVCVSLASRLAALGEPASTTTTTTTEQCCPMPLESSVAPAPHPAPMVHALPVDPAREIVFKVGKLFCPLVDGVGCGHLLAPTLAHIDGIDGVLRSYTNWTGSELRVTVAPKADLNAVAERVRVFLTSDQQEPTRLQGEEFTKALDSEEWRGVEQVVELTTYEYHTFARQQLGAYADEKKLDAARKQKLVALVDSVWDKTERASGKPQPDAEGYSRYWHDRLDKLKQTFAEDAKSLLTADEIEEVLARYGRH